MSSRPDVARRPVDAGRPRHRPSVAVRRYAAMRTGRFLVALHEGRKDAMRLFHHLDAVVALEDLLPDDFQLQLRKAQAHAAVDAEAEREVRARSLAVDDEVVRLLDHLIVAVARDVPHDDLVALPDCLALELDVLERRAAHVRQRRLPADHFRHEAVEQLRILLQLLELIGELAERVDAARQRVAGRVVAADDQQDQVAEEGGEIHVPRRFGVRHHRDQVALRRLLDALVPKPLEILGAFHQLDLTLLFRLDDTALARNRRRDVRPPRQLAPVVPGEVEQHGQHLRGEFDRDLVHPVEGLVARQAVEAGCRALADVDRELVEVGRGEHRRHRPPLRAVVRLVHRNEHRPAQLHRLVADGDAAELGIGREHLVVGLDLHDVVVLGDRPERSVDLAVAVVHRRFLAQAVEVRPEGIGAEKLGMARIELVERQRVRVLARLFQQIDRAVHRVVLRVAIIR